MNAFATILTAFVTAVLAAVGTVYAIEHWDLLREGAQTAETRAVPQLTGLSEEDARANLEAVDLRMIIAGREAASDAEPGTVIQQTPPAGTVLEKGQTVHVTFAAALPKVPEAVGLELEAAKRVLREAGYEPRVSVPAGSEEYPAGVIAEQTPVAGSQLAEGKEVTLRPSAGDPAVEVPDLKGLSLRGAVAKAKEAGLELDVQWISRAETASRVVLGQSPAADETVDPGSAVQVTVNR